MTQIVSGDIEALRDAMTGPVIGPDDLGYHDARRVWNAAIQFGRARGLEIAVRGGAHNMSGALASPA